jgi:hypothetical protein
MTYKKTLFFIGKCLTINHEDHNKIIIENQLKSNDVDWDSIVKVSTSHYVFPALYCTFKKADLLDYLPQDLVDYMQHITQLNRERNIQIIKQAKEINELLISNNITPIFLKGTAFLLQGLYDDIAERMVGDIDFLVEKKEFKKSIELLKNIGYSEFHKNKPDSTVLNRHYPKMVKEGRISSIEIHYRMVSRKSFSEFDYNFVIDGIQKKDKIHFLSNEDNIIMTCINKHINEYGDVFKGFSMRNSYDLFLLSKISSPKNSIQKLKKYVELNNFLFSSYTILNKPSTLDFFNTKKAYRFLEKQLYYLDNPKAKKRSLKWNKFRVTNARRINKLVKSIYDAEHRNYLIARIKSMF